MPFYSSWNADGTLGDLNLPNINLARFQSRFFLPTGPVLGMSTQWRGPSGLQLVAGGGEPGLYQGVVVPSFATLGGSTATLGAQWSPAAHWTVGGQLVEARDCHRSRGRGVPSPRSYDLHHGLSVHGLAGRLDSHTVKPDQRQDERLSEFVRHLA